MIEVSKNRLFESSQLFVTVHFFNFFKINLSFTKVNIFFWQNKYLSKKKKTKYLSKQKNTKKPFFRHCLQETSNVKKSIKNKYQNKK
ncbi:MAG: hypothetical protein EAZ44_07550 [Cytophagia bacterium]|nr:MAG: hypothetical protein EAZ44_07550 [Cytophagia bacterium]TAG41509.1 MAG: hypothetical protein EAZ31_07355 [Cytophagia bacterium]TAH28229.1 MAG: hypothetical protein EAZ06_10755 [Cytophagales bacterium]